MTKKQRSFVMFVISNVLQAIGDIVCKRFVIITKKLFFSMSKEFSTRLLNFVHPLTSSSLVVTNLVPKFNLLLSKYAYYMHHANIKHILSTIVTCHLTEKLIGTMPCQTKNLVCISVCYLPFIILNGNIN